MTGSTLGTLARQLPEWLASTDIDYLEVRSPEGILCLANQDGLVVAVAPGQTVDTDEAQRSSEHMVRADSVGRFQLAHPLRTEPLVTPGDVVSAGQVIGLLRAGPLLLPITAPEAGTVDSFCAADGSTVDYGAPLVAMSLAKDAEPVCQRT